jgi:hypothetical protein
VANDRERQPLDQSPHVYPNVAHARASSASFATMSSNRISKVSSIVFRESGEPNPSVTKMCDPDQRPRDDADAPGVKLRRRP